MSSPVSAAPPPLAAAAANERDLGFTGIAPVPSDGYFRSALLLILALAFVLLVGASRGHVDDTDAQLYQVIARHLVEDRGALALRYEPGIYPAFHEHLPFGFWPFAAAVAVFGEGALPFAGALMSLACVL